MGLSSKQVSSDSIDWNKATLECTRTLKFPNTTTSTIKIQPQLQQQNEPLNCPRCDSTHTKFCYYNNYNKSQPRHFCKTCKRHWTKGGTLRNVPVGGGRKNKRLKTFKNVSKTTTSTTTTNAASHLISGISNNNNNNNSTLQPQNLRMDIIEENNTIYQSQTSILTFNNKGLLNDEIFQHHDYNNDQEIQIPYSNLGNFENNNNPCSISSTITSIQSPNLYNFTSDHESNCGLFEETKMSNNNVGEFLDSIYTCAPKISTNNRNWESWDDFDTFVSVEANDGLTIPWNDDSDIKP